MDDVPMYAGDAQMPVMETVAGVGVTSSGPKNDMFYKPWDKFTKKRSAKTTPSIDRDEEGEPSHHPEVSKDGVVVTSQSAVTSYDEAAAACKAKVDAIVAECRRLNVKYYDPLFDLSGNQYDCLVSLSPYSEPDSVKGLDCIGSVKRIEDIYEKPQFFIDGVSANDVRQGYVGDCWFLAAITALSGKPELLEKICVARDEKVGVYGFVFYRDGEWISEVVDDRLCLKRGDDNTKYPTEYMLNVSGSVPLSQLTLGPGSYSVSKLPREFRESLRKGSNALYFSSCKDSNETWLPLLEKAYAKAHGDYQAIEGGFTGEGIEDLTGGVAIMLPSENILDKDRLWFELMAVNKEFLFGCGSRQGFDSDPSDEEGFVRGHAYTVLEAREITYKGEQTRLLKIRNPWGEQEWNGAWSDGSKEWTSETMKELKHTFGDDGVFWISYKDFLRYYPDIDRIRLFGPEWTVTQQWTSVDVPWTSEYLDTQFSVSLAKKSAVVIVLAQPDNRYFQGLKGRYNYDLHFRVYKDGQKTYLLRSMAGSGSGRSCTAELELEPGNYTVFVKITTRRWDSGKTPEEVIKENRESRREKLLAIGKSFDLTHSKGKLREAEKAGVLREKKEAKAKTKAQAVAARLKRKKDKERERKRKARIEAETEKKKALKKAEKKAEEEAAAKARAEEHKDDEEGEEKKVEESEKKDGEVEKKDEGEKKDEAAESKAEPAEKKAEVKGESSSTEKEPAVAETAKPAKQPEVVISPPEASKDAVPATPITPVTPSTPTASGHPPKGFGAKPGAQSVLGSDKSPASSVGQPTPTSSQAGSAATDKPEAEESKDEAAPAEEKAHMDKKEMVSELREIATQLEAEDEEDDDVDVSDVDDDDFDWDSEIDGSDTEDEDDDDEGDDLYAEDPWRAICVMGLKVYHRDAGVEISVTHKDA